MKKIGIIGSGIIGSSWALLFARAGHSVIIYDHKITNLHRAQLQIEKMLIDSSTLLSEKNTVSQVVNRVEYSNDLKEAVLNADYVQEAVPEDINLKKLIFSQLDAYTKPSAILASSTSTFGASLFTEDLNGRERCIVVHPFTPPHLMPVVEIACSKWTSEEVLYTSTSFMKEVGQTPVLINKEVSGFVLNRLQGALLTEMFNLISQGVISPRDADLVVSQGLGLRWAALGPLEGVDLNSSKGIQGYLEQYGHIFNQMALDNNLPPPVSEGLIENISKALRSEIPLEALEDKKSWRDKTLSKVVEITSVAKKDKPCS